MKSRSNFWRELWEKFNHGMRPVNPFAKVDIEYSTRQSCRQSLFHNAWIDAHKFAVPRRNRRKIARSSAKREWQKMYASLVRGWREQARASARRMQEPGLPNPYAKLTTSS